MSAGIATGRKIENGANQKLRADPRAQRVILKDQHTVLPMQYKRDATAVFPGPRPGLTRKEFLLRAAGLFFIAEGIAYFQSAISRAL